MNINISLLSTNAFFFFFEENFFWVESALKRKKKAERERECRCRCWPQDEERRKRKTETETTTKKKMRTTMRLKTSAGRSLCSDYSSLKTTRHVVCLARGRGGRRGNNEDYFDLRRAERERERESDYRTRINRRTSASTTSYGYEDEV